jgi:hypothetical protein
MYPLALSVINDPASYEARRHAARKLLEGYYDRETFRRDIRAICALKARDERAAFGVKIKPQEITTQSAEVAENALDHARDTIRARYTGGQCFATIRRWWDRQSGNSYFSVFVRVPQDNGGFASIRVPYQYGRDDQPRWETVDQLIGLGIFSKAEDHRPASYPVDFEDLGYVARRTL